jgi:hypothetical protein
MSATFSIVVALPVALAAPADPIDLVIAPSVVSLTISTRQVLYSHASSGGVHLDAGESSQASVMRAAEKILGDKKHAEGFSRRVTVARSSIQHRNASWPAKSNRIKGSYRSDRHALGDYPSLHYSQK